jgi:hypothetical protein
MHVYAHTYIYIYPCVIAQIPCYLDVDTHKRRPADKQTCQAPKKKNIFTYINANRLMGSADLLRRTTREGKFVH